MHELAAQLKFSESLIVHSLSSQLLKDGLEQVNTTILQFQDIQLQIENMDTGDDDYQIPEWIKYSEASWEVKSTLMSLIDSHVESSLGNN